MFQTNINCYLKGRHSSSNFTNVLTYIFWISENIISKSVTSTNPMMRSYKYALCAVFLLLYVKIHTLEYLMNRVELMIVHNMVYPQKHNSPVLKNCLSFDIYKRN